MRIQHNILAMNAYRNYNNNTSALGKNLEKLSSGYKINRAGDDAAGLAISEKMRAQITGLNAAQKNVKDGVSLVKTAEGAMQEIQDMLNRMDYLATQSANGTYDNEVDRANLQKEVDALKTEINRIADSANFNGIKLLDGSLDENKKAIDATSETITEVIDPNETIKMEVGGALPEVGLELGVDTVKHNTANSKNGTEFSVAFHDFEFNNQEGDEMSIKVGDTTITLKSNAANVSGTELTTLKGNDLVSKILTGTSGNYEVTVNGQRFDAGDKITINGQDFTVTTGVVENTDKHTLKFIQDKAPTNEAEEIDGSMKVTVSGDIAATKAKFSFKLNSTPVTGDTITLGEGREAVEVTIDAATTAGIKAALDQFDDFNATVTGDATQGWQITLEAKNGGAMEPPKITFKSPSKYAAISVGGTPATAGVAGKIAAATGKAGVEAVGSKVTFAVSFGSATGTEATVTGNMSVSGSDGGKLVLKKGESDEGTCTVSGVAAKYSFDGTNLTFEITGMSASANGFVLATTANGTSTASDAAIATYGGIDANKGTAQTVGSAVFSLSGAGAALTKDSVLTLGEGDDAIKITKDDLKNFTGSGTVVKIGDQRYKLTFSGGYTGTATTGTLTIEEVGEVAKSGSIKGILKPKIETVEDVKVKTEDKGSDLKKDGMTGDYNVSTVDIKNVDSGGQHRLASTYFDLTDDMVRDGSKIRIGSKTYTFTTDKDKVGSEGYVDATSGDLSTIAKNLTTAASGNATWTVGHDGSRITVTETLANDKLYDSTGKFTGDVKKDYDLSTKEGIEESLGFEGVAYEKTETTTTEAVEGGKPLTLQIGDTSDEFNQMKVSVGDMHTAAMKVTDEETGESTSIADIDISSQEGAAAAVNVIKGAINYVSSVRGDLGAIQNRLEHTQNNLSVMAENIQDAESTIRDTDVADEMMSYVKNNILVQSAQAMLAQANQVPQGVLQLLG